MQSRHGVVSGAIALAALTGIAVGGPDWEEGSLGSGDAGRLPSTAQVPQGPAFGILETISGSLSGFGEIGPGDFQDMFAIWILTPTVFSASTETFDGGMSAFDSQLWLFDSAGLGLLGVDGVGPGAAMGNMSTDSSGIVITTPGLYYLAVSLVDSDPLDAIGDRLFDQFIPGEVSGPDGPGGLNPISGWSAPPPVGGGDYVIAMTGTAFVPSPGAGFVLGLLGATFTRPRRRRVIDAG